MVIAIEPETGRPGMPSTEQMRALQPVGVSSLNQSDVGLPVVHGPGGAVGIDLQGRFQDYYVIHVGPDGRRTVTCAEDSAAIGRALDPKQSPPTYYEEK